MAGKVETVKSLLKDGADINQKGRVGSKTSFNLPHSEVNRFDDFVAGRRHRTYLGMLQQSSQGCKGATRQRCQNQRGQQEGPSPILQKELKLFTVYINFSALF